MHVIVPIKRYALAKQRLAGGFTAEQRRHISRATAEATLCELSSLRGVDGVVVVTAERSLHRLVRAYGFDLHAEDGRAGLNSVLEDALAALRRRRVVDACIVHSDIPLFSASELHKVLEVHTAGRERQLTLVTDRAGRGTNVRACRPLDAVPCLYGPGSARLHAARARAAALHVERVRSEALALDLDRCDDVAAILSAKASMSPVALTLQRWVLNRATGRFGNVTA